MIKRNELSDLKLIVSFLLLLLCCMGKANAQDWRYKARLDVPEGSGFYKIAISPELSALSNAGLTDIRISDSANFVPYIIRRSDEQVVKRGEFISFPIISTITDSNHTTIILENTTQGGISNLSLIIRNTAVERYTALSASDDQQKWYIIDDHILFQKSDNYSTGSFIQTIHFPFSKSRYLKLKVNNAHTDPLDIALAGIFKNSDSVQPAGFINNPKPEFYQKDSAEISYVIINNKSSFITNRVIMAVSGPKFFHRTAHLYVMQDEKDSVGLLSPVGTFSITSGSNDSCPSFTFNIQARKAATLVVTILNEDNPALKINNISTAQQKQYLIAWLEKGKSYTLLAGNTNEQAPSYDLAQFKDSIPAVLNELTFGPLTLIPKQPAKIVKTTTNYWLWPAIVLSVLALGFLTFRLVKDINREKTAS